MTAPLSAIVVPDASVGAKWYLDDEEDTAKARSLYQYVLDGNTTLLVPDCFFYELVGLVRKAERRVPPRLSKERAVEIVAAVAVLNVSQADTRLFLVHALELSHELDIAPYDALYLAVAERAGATYVTADAKLYERIRHLRYVRWLATIPLPAAAASLTHVSAEDSHGASIN